MGDIIITPDDNTEPEAEPVIVVPPVVVPEPETHICEHTERIIDHEARLVALETAPTSEPVIIEVPEPEPIAEPEPEPEPEAEPEPDEEPKRGHAWFDPIGSH